MNVPSARSWMRLCAVHGAASLWMWWLGAGATSAYVWHAGGWISQPWTLWTSAWVHLSSVHLVSNLLALGGVAAAGWVLRADVRCTLAWGLAWPLSQVSLLLWPSVDYAAGLSGAMHAGTLVLAAQLALGRLPVRGGRFWGVLLMAGVLTKVVLERGWAQPLVWQDDTGIYVALAAHVTGAFWGVLLGLGLALWPRKEVGAGEKKPAEAGL